MFLELTVGAVTGRAAITSLESEPVRRLLAVLPLTDSVLVPSCWSGPVCEIDLSAAGFEFGSASGVMLGCSLYPGMVLLRRDLPLLEISYGAAEARSATGVQYGLAISRFDDDSRELFAALRASHDVGCLSGTLRAVNR
jgi:hypothetical protein